MDNSKNPTPVSAFFARRAQNLADFAQVEAEAKFWLAQQEQELEQGRQQPLPRKPVNTTSETKCAE